MAFGDSETSHSFALGSYLLIPLPTPRLPSVDKWLALSTLLRHSYVSPTYFTHTSIKMSLSYQHPLARFSPFNAFVRPMLLHSRV